MATIELREVTKRFGDATVVDRASLNIADGELFVLVGPSGCGKSTLLNMIVGLERATEGEILVDGARINDRDPKDRNMAMVFQSYAIYPHMSVRENMSFPLRLAKMEPARIAARVEETARMLAIADLLDRRPRDLSGGERQRVAMGRALVREPDVFLLDEPLSNLDARLRTGMRAEIARLQRRLGTTTVYVTHDQTEAMTLGDRIAVMRDGRIQQIGTPRELYERPCNAFVAGFIGVPPMNLVPARRRANRVETPLGSFTAAGGAGAAERPDAPLLAGFRAEHARTGPGDGEGLRFPVRVDVVEWLGADVHVHFEVADERPGGGENTRRDKAPVRLVARVDPARGVTAGDRLELFVPAERILLFDGVSGERLVP